MNIDTSKLVAAEDLVAETPGETDELKQMHREATSYISRFAWCRGICESYFGGGVAGIIGLFLFHIRPSKREVDKWVWVVVGDLPPAYLSGRKTLSPADAFRDYIRAMRHWANAVKEGNSIAELFPVDAPPVRENALNLEKRLKFLEEHIAPRLLDPASPFCSCRLKARRTAIPAEAPRPSRP